MADFRLFHRWFRRMLILAGAIAPTFLAGCTKEKQPDYLQGYVEGEYLYMAPMEAGILQTLNVAQGDTVASGTLLFTMDPTPQREARTEALHKLAQGRELLEDAQEGMRPTEIEALDAQLKQAEAALTLALKTFERQRLLYQDKVISAEELDRARSDARQKQETVQQMRAQLATGRQGDREHQIHSAQDNVKALEAALAKTEWNLQQTSQTAPRDALVFDTYFRSGEFVPAGRPIVSLLPPENVRVRAFVPQGQVGSLATGTSATIFIDGVSEPAKGSVSFISPKAEFTPPVIYSQQMREKLSFMVEISFPPDVAKKLNPGQPVDVDFGATVK